MLGIRADRLGDLDVELFSAAVHETRNLHLPSSGLRTRRKRRSDVALRYHSTTLTISSSSLALLRPAFIGYVVTRASLGKGSQTMHISSMSTVELATYYFITASQHSIDIYDKMGNYVFLISSISFTPRSKWTWSAFRITDSAHRTPELDKGLIKVARVVCAFNQSFRTSPKKI